LPEEGLEQTIPLKLSSPHNTKCWYTIWDSAHPKLEPIVKDKEVKIQTKEGNNYIYIEDPGVINPFVEIKIEHDKQERISDSYYPKEGFVFFPEED
jgi:hypothetical protein